MNEELIEARVREINDAVQMLRDLVARDFGELTIYEKLSIRYLVIQLVEAASSICMHLLISIFNEKAEGFPDCFTRLGARSVIPSSLAQRLSSAARLRNLLVHRYWTIVDEKVYESVKRGLDDFECFISEVRAFLSGMHKSSMASDPAEPEFKYYELPAEERGRIIDLLRERLGCVDDIVFAYIHGSFVEGSPFRDIDIAVWIKSEDKAFYYTVDFSANLQVEVGIPIDIHVLNEAPLTFKHHVFTSGKLLHSKNEEVRLRVVDQTVRMYMDLKRLTEEAEL